MLLSQRVEVVDTAAQHFVCVRQMDRHHVSSDGSVDENTDEGSSVSLTAALDRVMAEENKGKPKASQQCAQSGHPKNIVAVGGARMSGSITERAVVSTSRLVHEDPRASQATSYVASLTDERQTPTQMTYVPTAQPLSPYLPSLESPTALTWAREDVWARLAYVYGANGEATDAAQTTLEPIAYSSRLDDPESSVLAYTDPHVFVLPEQVLHAPTRHDFAFAWESGASGGRRRNASRALMRD
jgi:hypothetical protein